MSTDYREAIKVALNLPETPIIVDSTSAAALTAEMLSAYLCGDRPPSAQINARFEECVLRHLHAQGLTPLVVTSAQFDQALGSLHGQCIAVRQLTTPRWQVDTSAKLNGQGQHRREAVSKRLLAVCDMAAKTLAAGIARVPAAQLICVCTPSLWVKHEFFTVDAFAWTDVLCYPDS